jgi:hypothetical protein
MSSFFLPLSMKSSMSIIIGLLVLAPLGCGSSDPSSAINSKASNSSGPEFEKYWNQGLAEVSSYTLTQARYGEYRNGDAVMIYVTEPFSKSKQLKLDNPGGAGDDAVQVLKLNAVRKFVTGVYPYSMMNSSFSPVNSTKMGSMLKSTCSSQEWCGHTFTQWNKSEDAYLFKQFSYFESEADVQLKMKNVLLEDEIWTLLRLNPQLLPTGDVQLVPANFYSRLRHIDVKSHSAMASLRDSAEFSIYTLNYPELERELKIYFQSEFPYTIQSWEDSYVSGWGSDAQKRTTKAVLKKRMMIDYWNKNGLEDEGLREELGLGY